MATKTSVTVSRILRKFLPCQQPHPHCRLAGNISLLLRADARTCQKYNSCSCVLLKLGPLLVLTPTPHTHPDITPAIECEGAEDQPRDVTRKVAWYHVCFQEITKGGMASNWYVTSRWLGGST